MIVTIGTLSITLISVVIVFAAMRSTAVTLGGARSADTIRYPSGFVKRQQRGARSSKRAYSVE